MKSNKIKILQIVRDMGPGGLEHVVLDLIDHLNNDLFEMKLLCIHQICHEYKEKLKARNLPFYMIEKEKEKSLNFYLKLFNLLRSQRFDIVHAHSGCFIESMLPARMAGVKKVVFTAHGIPVRSRLSFIEEPVAALLAHKITAVSDEIGRYLKNSLKLSRNKIDVIPNGIDLNKFHPANSLDEIKRIRAQFGLPGNAVIIGTVGRLVKLKNQAMLIRAFSNTIDNTKEEIHLTIVGEGPESNQLENLCNRLSIEKHVTFLGNRDDVSVILRAFDLFAMSSRTEGTSISLLESQATGLPAVVTDVGGNRMIIQNEINGFLVPNGDEAAMSQKLLHILDSDNRPQMAKKAQEHVKQHFSLKQMIDYYRNLYSNCANAK